MNKFKQELESFKKVDIQFFGYTDIYDLENGEEIESRRYSANVIFDEKFIVQISGNDEEAHKPYVPSSREKYFNDSEHQDEMCNHEQFDYDLIDELLERFEIVNNFDYLYENRDQTLDL